MSGHTTRYGDFDGWAALARTDPERFEERRAIVIEDLLAGAGQHEQRLRALQWRIDMERRRAPNPMAACVRLHQMMWESFAGRDGLRAALLGGRGRGASSRGRRAHVITLKRRPASRSGDPPADHR